MDRLRTFIKQQAFNPGWLGMVTNTSYIIRSRLFRAIRSKAPSVHGRVLDFGCGSKPYEALFSHATEYIGVDIHQSGHSHADSKVDVFYDGTELPFPDAHFDAIVSFEVFEHIFNLGEMLNELRRVLKPGGQLLVSLPFAWHEHEQPYDFARYTSFGIAHELERHAFEIVSVEKTTGYFLALAQLLISFLALSLSWLPYWLFAAVRLFLIFPMTAISVVLDKLLPQRNEFFSNMVVLAKAAGRDSDESGKAAAR